MTDQLTDEAKALLDGATPGPWRADGEPWNRVVWSSADNRVCFMAHSNGLDDERDIATSNLAAAAPDLARALLDARAERGRLAAELAAAQQREAGLVDALKPVRDALDAWRRVLRDGRTVDASITGLGDMIRLLDAALSHNGRKGE